MEDWLSQRSKMIIAVTSAVIGLVTVFTIAEDILPAHRGYVLAQNKELAEKLNLAIDKIGGELRILQRQQNDSNREQLRKEKFDLEIRLRAETNHTYQALIRQRLDQIEYALERMQ